jgi:hypothetical protein
MRMRAPLRGIGWTSDYLDCADAIAEALASRLRHEYSALALRFDSNEIHGRILTQTQSSNHENDFRGWG